MQIISTFNIICASYTMGACVRYVVFPIRSKILKPGLWVVEKKSKYPSFFQVLK